MKEHEKAKRWRESHSLSHEQLGALTGYSRESIYWFERGETPPRIIRGKKVACGEVKPWVWLRYKRACEGVERHLRTGKEWNW